jgi:hypothetical protein
VGIAKPEIDSLLGAACLRPWKLVSLPFQAEYPGDRRWNRNAAQYCCTPVEGEHPHWDMLLRHSFGDLDAAIKENPVAQKMGIKTGADYGLLWAAFCLREPYRKLPYLFFYGDQEGGKSTYHEAFEFLMTKGFVSANNALRSQNDFNGELAGCIVATIEEINLMHTKGAFSKLKDWVMSEWLPIRQMRTDTYQVLNTLHFIQVANDPSYCPIFPGDTRITMIFVPPLGPKTIARDYMRDFLKKEAPHFLWTLLNVKLPSPESRLRLPIIETDKKLRAQRANRSALEAFLADCTFPIAGARIAFADFYERFYNSLSADEQQHWNKRKVSRELPHQFPQGVHTQNVKWIGNLSWEANVPEGKPWIVHDGRLRQD